MAVAEQLVLSMHCLLQPRRQDYGSVEPPAALVRPRPGSLLESGIIKLVMKPILLESCLPVQVESNASQHMPSTYALKFIEIQTRPCTLLHADARCYLLSKVSFASTDISSMPLVRVGVFDEYHDHRELFPYGETTFPALPFTSLCFKFHYVTAKACQYVPRTVLACFVYMT